MKIKAQKIAFFVLLTAALTAAPAVSRAADSTNAAAASAPAVQRRNPPLHGKVAAVDTNAMTFTVGSTTLAVGSTTRITKDGKPAVLADIAVGANVNVSYKKDDAGKATALSVRVAAPRKEAAPAPAAGQQ
jgi:hypothetical protein